MKQLLVAAVQAHPIWLDAASAQDLGTCIYLGIAESVGGSVYAASFRSVQSEVH